MKFGDMFPSKYLRATDLTEPVTVRIKDVKIEEVGQEKEEKPVLYFVGAVKPIILNKTNANSIVNIVQSEDAEDWIGQKIELYSEMILMHGERKAAIRLRRPKAAKPPTTAPEAEDDVPDSWEDEPTTTAA